MIAGRGEEVQHLDRGGREMGGHCGREMRCSPLGGGGGLGRGRRERQCFGQGERCRGGGSGEGGGWGGKGRFGICCVSRTAVSPVVCCLAWKLGNNKQHSPVVIVSLDAVRRRSLAIFLRRLML